jgi:hypothetical protein
MSVPSKTDPRWEALATEKLNPAFKALAIRLCLTRVRLEVKNNPAKLRTAIDELHAFFTTQSFAAAEAHLIK